MKYSEKKKIHEFVMRILEYIEGDMHSYNHVSRTLHNAKIEIEKFLDDDLNYTNIKCFLPTETRGY